MTQRPIRHLLVSPILMWVIVAAGVALEWWLLPGMRLFHRNAFTVILFIAALFNWVYFFTGAIHVNRTVARSAAGVDRVITHGVYAKVRHPIYSADIILAWAIFLIFPTLRVLVAVAWLTVVLIVWMKLEEAVLLQRFGDEYLNYRMQTPMLIPGYWRKA